VGRDIKDDKHPSRMINIQHTRRGVNWKPVKWWLLFDDENLEDFCSKERNGGNYKEGRSKVGRKERFKKNVISLSL
jgi:hypothetical protein